MDDSAVSEADSDPPLLPEDFDDEQMTLDELADADETSGIKPMDDAGDCKLEEEGGDGGDGADGDWKQRGWRKVGGARLRLLQTLLMSGALALVSHAFCITITRSSSGRIEKSIVKSFGVRFLLRLTGAGVSYVAAARCGENAEGGRPSGMKERPRAVRMARLYCVYGGDGG